MLNLYQFLYSLNSGHFNYFVWETSISTINFTIELLQSLYSIKSQPSCSRFWFQFEFSFHTWFLWVISFAVTVFGIFFYNWNRISGTDTELEHWNEGNDAQYYVLFLGVLIRITKNVVSSESKTSVLPLGHLFILACCANFSSGLWPLGYFHRLEGHWQTSTVSNEILSPHTKLRLKMNFYV